MNKIKAIYTKQAKRLAVALVGVLALTCVSCNSSSVSTMMQASGRPGEVMLVMGANELGTPEAKTMQDAIEQIAPALPQEELSLQVTSRVSHENFNSILRLARNILVVNVDPERFSKSTLKYGYNEWAKGQIIVTLNTPHLDSVARYAREEQEVLQNMFVRHELYRFATGLEEKSSQRAKHLVDSLFAHHINVPADINKHKFGKNFLWMSNALPSKRHDLLVYTYPYNKPKDLTAERLVEVRDSVLKVNIPGGEEGSYPSTVKTGLVFRRVALPNQPMRSELRGLWQMEGGAMMGGPFVLQAYHNEADGLVYVFEGFVYRPNENKLKLIRTMEAGLYSARPKTAGAFDAQIILAAKYSKSL